MRRRRRRMGSRGGVFVVSAACLRQGRAKPLWGSQYLTDFYEVSAATRRCGGAAAGRQSSATVDFVKPGLAEPCGDVLRRPSAGASAEPKQPGTAPKAPEEMRNGAEGAGGTGK
eukprot:gene12246-biopygen15482